MILYDYMIICISYKTLVYISCIPDFPASHVLNDELKSRKIHQVYPKSSHHELHAGFLGGLLRPRGGLDLGSIAVLRHGDDVYCGPLGGVVLAKAAVPSEKLGILDFYGGFKGKQ